MEETSAVIRFKVTPSLIAVSNRRVDKVGPRQNVVISRDQVLIQLESLILAQSERWRQA